MAGSIQSFFIKGPAGQLESLLNAGSPDAARAALVCHPHPLFGGTMHNKVVYHCMKALNAFGYPVLRMNFRGTGLSEGAHDDGRGEQDDVRAALAWLRDHFQVSIIFAGFSFGAAAGLKACCGDADVAALISLGTPIRADDRQYQYQFLSSCKQPKLFISGTRDQYGPVNELKAAVDGAAEPKQLVLIDDVDHFFEPGGLPRMRDAIDEWVRELSFQVTA